MLHFVTCLKPRTRDRNAKRRESLDRAGNEVPRHGKRRSRHMVLQKTLTNKDGELTLHDHGTAEAVDMLRKTVEGQKPQEIIASVKACKHLPTFERHGVPVKSRMIFATKGPNLYKWMKQKGEEDHREPYMPLEEIMATMFGVASPRREFRPWSNMIPMYVISHITSETLSSFKIWTWISGFAFSRLFFKLLPLGPLGRLSLGTQH